MGYEPAGLPGPDAITHAIYTPTNNFPEQGLTLRTPPDAMPHPMRPKHTVNGMLQSMSPKRDRPILYPYLNPSTSSVIPLVSDHILHLPSAKSDALPNRCQSFTSEYTNSLSISAGSGPAPPDKMADSSRLHGKMMLPEVALDESELIGDLPRRETRIYYKDRAL